MILSPWRYLVLPLLLLLALFVLFDYCGWDLYCSDLFYFPAHGGWIYKHSWWAENLLHKGGRFFIVAITAISLVIIAESFSATSQLKGYRRAALYLVLVIALSTGIVALGKSGINRNCPWGYSRYGGVATYTPLLSAHPFSTAGRGHGFPAGHAAGGFSLVAFYFILREYAPRYATAGLVAAISIGTFFTFCQLVRGAHFISHSIVSLMICWLVSVLVYVFLFNGQLR